MFLHTFEYLTKATTFPSLRNLNITMNVDLQRQPLPLPNDAALLRQLDVLVSDVPTALALADEHPSLTVIIETILGLPGTLFRPSVHWPSSYTAPIHIRVLPWKQFVPPPGPFYRLSEVTCIPPYTDLSDLLEWLVEEYPLDDKTKPVRLKSIDFPIKMYPTLQPNSRLEDVMERLVKALKRRGVKVGWSWREMTDGGIAPEMKKWVREEKARRRAPGVGVWR